MAGRSAGAVAGAVLLLVALLLMPGQPLNAAVPEADHVRLKLVASRLNVNDYSIRKQIRVDMTVSASDAARLDRIEDSRLTVINPSGVSARVKPFRVKLGERRFKAGHADLVFKLIEDSASRHGSSVPRGYFNAAGPYRVRIDMRWESYRGIVSFGAPVALKLAADGQALSSFVLPPGVALEVASLPQRFGPVYYKRPDTTNFAFQLAGIDDALTSGDYRPPVESPQFFFQIRAGRIGQEQTTLVDPAAYIPGAQPHMIRSDSAATPISFPAGAFSAGQTLLIDFSRSETAEPDSVFSSTNRRFSEHVVIQERVVYALEVRDPALPRSVVWSPPTPDQIEELP